MNTKNIPNRSLKNTLVDCWSFFYVQILTQSNFLRGSTASVVIWLACSPWVW